MYKKIIIFSLLFLLVVGGLFISNIGNDDIKVCTNLNSPIIDSSKPLQESIIDFENHQDFKGYKLNDYKVCK